jgi:hypothetical protein
MANTITLPYDINNGDALDADKVMSDLEAITTEYNSTVGGEAGDIVTTSNTKTLTNKTLTSPVINTGVSGSAIDADSTMAANSDTILPTQKAVKTAIAAKVINRAFTWYLDGTSIDGVAGATYIAPQNMTVVKTQAKLTSGTCTATLKKGSTTINAISCSDTLATDTSITSAAITAGDIITLTISSASSPVGLIVTMECTMP